MGAGRASDRGSVSGYSGDSNGRSSSSGSNRSGGSSAGSMGAGRASDRGSVSGYSGDSQSGGGRGNSGRGNDSGTGGRGGSMADGRASDRGSVSGYAGSNGQGGGSTAKGDRVGGGSKASGGSMAAGRQNDRNSVGGYAGPSATRSTDKGDRIGSTPTGFSPSGAPSASRFGYGTTKTESRPSAGLFGPNVTRTPSISSVVSDPTTGRAAPASVAAPPGFGRTALADRVAAGAPAKTGGVDVGPNVQMGSPYSPGVAWGDAPSENISAEARSLGRTSATMRDAIAGAATGKVDRPVSSALAGYTQAQRSLTEAGMLGLDDRTTTGRVDYTSPTERMKAGYQEAQATMPMAGVMGLDGRTRQSAMNAVAPSARAAENASMSALANMEAPTQRQTEIAAMERYDAVQQVLSLARKDSRPKDPYNALVSGRKGAKTPAYADLENMTIAEVMSMQKGMKRAGHLSSAVGAYQMLAATLENAVEMSGLPTSAKFSKPTQDFLAMALVDNRARRATVNGVVDPAKFANELANEWASFKTSSGKGRYDGDGVNKGYVSHASVRAAADALTGSGAIGGPKGSVTSLNNSPDPSVFTGPQNPTGPTSTPPAVDFQRPDYVSDRPVAGVEPSSGVSPSKPKDQSAPTETPATGPIPGDRPTKRDLTTGQTIAAAGIDAGLSSLPGLGMGIGLVNGVLTLTGKNTIGEMMVTGQGKSSSGPTEAHGGDDWRSTQDRQAAGAQIEDADKAIQDSGATRFERIFLKDRAFLTPKEKWGGLGVA